jgi:hypothetical protein
MEVALFNKNGKPVAYIAEDGETIYSWDGRAVAYIAADRVYGWNGRPLGWYSDGTIFDIYGYRAGFIKRKSPVPTQLEPGKPAKQMPRIRQMHQAEVVKPAMVYGYSRLKLEELLEKGAA